MTADVHAFPLIAAILDLGARLEFTNATEQITAAVVSAIPRQLRDQHPPLVGARRRPAPRPATPRLPGRVALTAHTQRDAAHYQQEYGDEPD